MQVQSVGAYDAKTRLPQLLREVQAGREFVISVRGQPVARLAAASNQDTRQVAVEKMRTFMRSQAGAAVGEGLDVREMIESGRA